MLDYQENNSANPPQTEESAYSIRKQKKKPTLVD
jgi:hypothetical protein